MLLVSFDFDDTLAMTVETGWGGISKVLNPIMKERMERHVKEGDEVIIVSSRMDEWKYEIEDFVKQHKLPVKEIHCTNMAWKANRLKKLHVNIHYDDYNEEIRRLRCTKVKGILVTNGRVA